jgi:hypothetical protein
MDTRERIEKFRNFINSLPDDVFHEIRNSKVNYNRFIKKATTEVTKNVASGRGSRKHPVFMTTPADFEASEEDIKAYLTDEYFNIYKNIYRFKFPSEPTEKPKVELSLQRLKPTDKSLVSKQSIRKPRMNIQKQK